MTALREEALWISPDAYLEGEKISPIKHDQLPEDRVTRYNCIVAEGRMEVTVYRRKSANWEIMQWKQPEDVFYLGAFDCELTLAQIYERVFWNVAA